jgi:hypothetical protein
VTPMGRRRARLVLRDLAAGAAFSSMGLSGELPAWAVVVFGVGLFTALCGARPLARIPLGSGLLLAGGAVVLYAAVGAGGLDLVVAACTFASLLTVQRLLSAPAPRTDHQVLLTSLLMISGGAALSGELLFAVALVVFAVLACFCLLLGVLERAAGQRARLHLGPAVRATAWGMVMALLGAAVLFALFPRLSWNVAGRRASRGLGATTGLNESGLRLTSGQGSIKSNPRVVARVELSPDPGREALDGYFLAGTYGTFTGTAWTDDFPPEARSHRVVVRPLGEGTPLLRQKYELLPAYGAQVAVALVEPLMFAGARTFHSSGTGQTELVARPFQDVRFSAAADGYAYQAYSALRPEALEPPAPLTDEARAHYLALPPALDPRIAALAASAVNAESDPLRAAQRLEAWLKREYGYTLDLPQSDGDPLAIFLFETGAGHCEYFASAMAVMLRTLGIPARVATGFFGGERSGDDGTYLVRAGDAHAWTQVWIDGRGFVNLDATPDAGRSAQPAVLMGWVLRQYERVEALWRNAILEYSLRDQARLVTGLLERDAPATGRGQLPPPDRRGWIAAAALALCAYGAWRLRLLRRRTGPQHPATRLRQRALALLARHRIALLPGEGFEDLARRLAQAHHPCADALREVVDAWVAARFGGRPLTPAEHRALTARLRTALQARDAPARAA